MKRDHFSMPLDLGHELAIDNFAGGGGASTGIAMGLGREVDIAINHNGEALAMHAANHPTAAHYTEDVFGVHPGFITKQLPIGLAWFSPDCKHFSKAKGAKPVEKKIRGLAWVTLKWATFQYPRVIALENVEEFQDWGPLDEDNKPLKADKGRTFKAFVLALSTGIPADHSDLEEIHEVLGADFPIERLVKGLGYAVEWRVLRACDYGTPTIRKRLFMVARRDGLPIVWPAPTHGDPKSDGVKAGKLLPWRTAAECIDWSIPCPSIFTRTRPLKEATCRRIAKGIMKFVVNSADPFIVGAGGPIYSGKPVGINQPLGTLTAENHRYIVQPIIAPVITEHANASSPRSWSAEEPLRTICAQVKGGHHALVTAFLAKHYGGVVGTGVDVPTGTVTSVDHHSIVTAQLIGCGGRAGQSRPRDVNEPTATITGKADTALITAHLTHFYTSNTAGGQGDLREPIKTITAGGQHAALVRAFLIKYYGNEKDGVDPRDPMHTLPTKDRIGLVTIRGEDYAIVDIGLRMLSPRELARAQGFPDSYILNPLHNGKPLSKSAQVRMIGNSVCPPMAAAIVRANFGHESKVRRAA